MGLIILLRALSSWLHADRSCGAALAAAVPAPAHAPLRPLTHPPTHPPTVWQVTVVGYGVTSEGSTYLSSEA